MRLINRLLVASALAILASSAALAQQTGGGQTGGGQGGSGGVNAGPNNEANFTSVVAVPSVSGISNSGRSSALSQYNAFGSTYWNPQALGNPMSANATSGASAFGVALYGTGTGTSSRGVGTAGGIGSSAASGNRTTGTMGASATGGNTSAFSSQISGTNATGLTGATGATGGRTGTTGLAGGTTGLAGTTGMMGGTTGIGGRQNQMGMMGGTTNTAIVAQGGRDVSYSASFRSPIANPYTPTRVQTDLKAMFNNTATFSGGKAIDIQVLDAGVVVLRGSVKDEDEARLIEGMTRLTPGVRDVKNELKPGG